MKFRIWSPIAIIAISAVCFLTEPAAREDTIEIEADHMQFNEKTGINFYSGNVRMKHAGIQVEAEELRVFSKNNKLDHIIASSENSKTAQNNPSSLVRFTHKNDAGNEVIAYASTLYYFEKESRLLLEGEAELHQGTNRIRSQGIEYHIKNQAVVAGNSKNHSDPSKPGRVHMTITPENKNKDENQATIK